MKNLLLLGLSFILLSCVASKLDDKLKEVVFQEQTIVGTKQAVRNKLHMFVNENFADTRSTLQTNEDGLLAGLATLKLKCNDMLCVTWIMADVKYFIRYDENKYKLKIMLASIYIYSDKKGYEYGEKYWGTFSKEVDESFKGFNEKLNKYMISNDDNF